MEKENFFIKMEVYMTAIGNKIKWMGMVHYIINLGSLLMKVIGVMTNFKGKENCTMKIHIN
jgi:hypothetical protein